MPSQSACIPASPSNLNSSSNPLNRTFHGPLFLSIYHLYIVKLHVSLHTVRIFNIDIEFNIACTDNVFSRFKRRKLICSILLGSGNRAYKDYFFRRYYSVLSVCCFYSAQVNFFALLIYYLSGVPIKPDDVVAGVVVTTTSLAGPVVFCGSAMSAGTAMSVT